MPVDPILAKLLLSLLTALVNGTAHQAPPALLAHVPQPAVWNAYWHADEPGSSTTYLAVTLADGSTLYSAASSAVSPSKQP
jgi:hypothetical protein